MGRYIQRAYFTLLTLTVDRATNWCTWGVSITREHIKGSTRFGDFHVITRLLLLSLLPTSARDRHTDNMA